MRSLQVISISKHVFIHRRIDRSRSRSVGVMDNLSGAKSSATVPSSGGTKPGNTLGAGGGSMRSLQVMSVYIWMYRFK